MLLEEKLQFPENPRKNLFNKIREQLISEEKKDLIKLLKEKKEKEKQIIKEETNAPE